MSGMFGGGSTNAYDEIVSKTTDENLTTENWELILNLCDKVQDEGQDGARNVIAAVLKRLAHRNPNVQLYALSLTEALSKNCGLEVNREIASRAFTQGLEKVVTDRNTHEKVRKRTLTLIAQWTAEFESDTTLGIMEDCYNSLREKNYTFETPQEPPPPAIDDEIRRKEEEELQRVLEMSMQDKGGRDQWASYEDLSSSGAGGSGASLSGPAGGAASRNAGSSSGGYVPYNGNSGAYNGGYSSSSLNSSSVSTAAPAAATTAASGYAPGYASPPVTNQSHTAQTQGQSQSQSQSPIRADQIQIVTRVKALHSFEPTEPGELAFEKGDVIKVVDRGYKDWWRGQLKGRTGIFPVNYVEPLPELTPAELAREAEQEAAVFAQAVNVEKLLAMLRALDPKRDNLADNEEIQELYRSSMALRPKIVKLIDKYSQKRADLVSMNETFIRARTIFDRMMEESLARHTTGYEYPYPRPNSTAYARPDSRAWAGYDQQQQPAYAPFPNPSIGAAPNPYERAPAYAAPAGQPQHQPQAQYAQPGVQYGAVPGYGGPQPAQQGQAPAQAQVGATGAGGYGPQGPMPYPAVQQQQQPQQPQQPVQQQAVQPEPVPVAQSPPAQAQQPVQEIQAQPQVQAQTQPQPQAAATTAAAATANANPNAGPPYIYDPKTTYADPNVQAWAQYYAQGGKDPTGSVYFISVPGVTDQVQQQPQQGPVGQVQGEQQAQHQIGQGQGQVQSAAEQLQTYQHQQQYQQPQRQSSVSTSPTRSFYHGAGTTAGAGAGVPAQAQAQLQTPVSRNSIDSINLPYPGPASDSGHEQGNLNNSAGDLQTGVAGTTIPGYAGGGGSLPSLNATSPVQQTGSPTPGVGVYPYGNPNAASSSPNTSSVSGGVVGGTPSWLLPRMGPSPVIGGGPQHQQGGLGLAGQLSGMSIHEA